MSAGEEHRRAFYRNKEADNNVYEKFPEGVVQWRTLTMEDCTIGWLNV